MSTLSSTIGVVIFAAFILGCVTGSVASRPPREVKDEHNDANDTDQPTYHDIRHAISAVANKLESLKREGDKYYRETDRASKKQYRIMVASVSVTAIYTIVTIGLFGFTVWQYNGNSTQIAAQIVESARLADSAQKSADIAQINQRAWLGPTNAVSDAPAKGRDLQVTVSYVNSGHQPALDVYTDAKTFIVSAGDDALGVTRGNVSKFLGDCLSTPPNDDAGIAYPTVGFSGYSLNATVDKNMITESVISGQTFIVLTGCFVYRTQESIRHSIFCFFFQNGKTKPAAWTFCPEGNYAE